MIKFEVENRFSGSVQFTAEIDCDVGARHSVMLGLAVRWAVSNSANLVGAYLGGANLVGAYLGGANLVGADLEGAYLVGANLRSANLEGAYLGGANLGGAYLRSANLGGANLRSANLDGANLGGAYLGGAYLDRAYLGGAYLRSANLGGLVIIQGPVRGDGYQYILYTSCLGGCVIKAGCRKWVGDDAIKQARDHCQTKTDKRYRAQSLRIVDYLEGELAAIREVSR
ncbi:pentapeptide repeat-containing protein [uncultured Planktomarina sp.]|jgi:hypothetical protein|uniref:pentapeptide repeat-containing protein n=1 Tax=uncultured Planktomarina sp. TaxID=1538529 RepID=UPI0032603DE6